MNGDTGRDVAGDTQTPGGIAGLRCFDSGKPPNSHLLAVSLHTSACHKAQGLEGTSGDERSTTSPRAASRRRLHRRVCLELGSPELTQCSTRAQCFLRPSRASQGHQSCPVPPRQHTRCSVREHLLPQAQNEATGALAAAARRSWGSRSSGLSATTPTSPSCWTHCMGRAPPGVHLSGGAV